MANGINIGVREFAKQVGCSHVLILNLIKAGKMPQNKDKTIPLDEGLIAYQNRKIKKTKVDKKKKSSTNRVNVKKNVSRETILSDDDEEEIETDKLTSKKLTDVRDIATQFNKARLAEKTYQAKLKEIEFKLKKGDLVERAAVEQDASMFASEVRERLTSIPVRVSALCERRTAREIEDVLTDAIQDVLTSLYKSKFVKAETDE